MHSSVMWPVGCRRAGMKKEPVFQRTFATKQEAKDAIFEWIVAVVGKINYQ